jgi:small subunit ribosomal protein S16
MLTIRLQRTGKRNQADFRIVLAEKEAPVKKKIVELLGSYNPRKKDFKVKEERLKYWIAQRVQLSPTVHNLLVTKGLLDAAKVKAFNVPKKKAETSEAAAITTPASGVAPEVTPPTLEGDQAPNPDESPTASVGVEEPAPAEEKPQE